MIRRVIIFVKISGSRAKWGRGNIVVVDIIIIIMSINNMIKNNRINIFELRVIIGRNLYTLVVNISVKKIIVKSCCVLICCIVVGRTPRRRFRCSKACEVFRRFNCESVKRSFQSGSKGRRFIHMKVTVGDALPSQVWRGILIVIEQSTEVSGKTERTNDCCPPILGGTMSLDINGRTVNRPPRKIPDW